MLPSGHSKYMLKREKLEEKEVVSSPTNELVDCIRAKYGVLISVRKELHNLGTLTGG